MEITNSLSPRAPVLGLPGLVWGGGGQSTRAWVRVMIVVRQAISFSFVFPSFVFLFLFFLHSLEKCGQRKAEKANNQSWTFQERRPRTWGPPRLAAGAPHPHAFMMQPYRKTDIRALRQTLEMQTLACRHAHYMHRCPRSPHVDVCGMQAEFYARIIMIGKHDLGTVEAKRVENKMSEK